MRTLPWYLPALTLLALGCAPPVADYVIADVPRGVDTGRAGRDASARPDGGASPDVGPDVSLVADAPTADLAGGTDVSDAPPGDDIPVFDVVREDRPRACVDPDRDGISDELAGAPDRRTSGMSFAPPDFLNIDSDDDGISDADEARRIYAGYPTFSLPAPLCGDVPDDCDADGLSNATDRDSDNDGLTDREEVGTHRTNPCSPDTDSDGVADLIEVAANSGPADAMRRPPTGSLFVTLPYRDRAGPQTREFDFRTRIRNADVMFLVDTTGSMGSTITQVRNTLSTRIVPGIVAAFGPGADVRYGMADHRDFAEGGSSDYSLRVIQTLNADPMLSQNATNALVAGGGGDGPESMVPAMHSLISGYGLPAYRGTATRMATTGDCGGDAMSYGWACFREGRVPILVLFSDAAWHNGPTMPTTNFYGSVPGAATYDQLVAEMRRRDAFFVGIDVASGATYSASLDLARQTRSVDAMGNPIAFRGTPDSVTTSVVNAVTTLAQSTRQDVSRRADGDPMETRLPAGRTAADFLTVITPLRATPPAPAGFERSDATTFYGVAPSTVVTFEVTFFNDFHRNTTGTAQLFRATISVLGRAGSVLDTIQVFIIVPTDPNFIG
ncbi:MAG: hypothetical protein U0325_16790 [Polyangiales bacterium]